MMTRLWSWSLINWYFPWTFSICCLINRNDAGVWLTWELLESCCTAEAVPGNQIFPVPALSFNFVLCNFCNTAIWQRHGCGTVPVFPVVAVPEYGVLCYKKNVIFHCYICLLAKVVGLIIYVYALMKIIAKFSVEESKCIIELLSYTSKPCGCTVPQKRQQYVSRSSVMDTTVKKQSQNPRQLNAICSIPEQNIWKNLSLKHILRMILYPMNYNFHCFNVNFNHAYIFLNIITLKNIDIVIKNDILGNDWRKI